MAAWLWPQLIVWGFSLPAGWLASGALGAPLTHEGVILLHHPAISIEVTPECGGFLFFSFLTALTLATGYRYRGRRHLVRSWPVWVLVAYVVTWLANTARIVSAVQGQLFVREMLPESYFAAIHSTIGMFVFIPALTGYWILLNRYYYENRT